MRKWIAAVGSLPERVATRQRPAPATRWPCPARPTTSCRRRRRGRRRLDAPRRTPGPVTRSPRRWSCRPSRRSRASRPDPGPWRRRHGRRSRVVRHRGGARGRRSRGGRRRRWRRQRAAARSPWGCHRPAPPAGRGVCPGSAYLLLQRLDLLLDVGAVVRLGRVPQVAPVEEDGLVGVARQAIRLGDVVEEDRVGFLAVARLKGVDRLVELAEVEEACPLLVQLLGALGVVGARRRGKGARSGEDRAGEHDRDQRGEKRRPNPERKDPHARRARWYLGRPVPQNIEMGTSGGFPDPGPAAGRTCRRRARAAQLRRMRGASSSATLPRLKTRTDPDVCETTMAMASVSREMPAAAMWRAPRPSGTSTSFSSSKLR